MKKVEERRKGGKKKKKNPREGVVAERNRWSETDNIQSQRTVPLFTEGRLKGSNVKGLQHFLDGKWNVTD